ncbi:hypothetical protein [Acetobacter malorum]|uniref:hypothetical protein n=1 Tax=Acetobacter malorum TaxID=178901 RepID=UPI0012E96DA0|nr:hypothetical protein [Acetobacter malorum]
MSLLDDSPLSHELKFRLKRQINQIILYLEHPECLNVQDTLEKLGGVTLVAHQADRLIPTQEATKKKESRSIYQKLLSTFGVAQKAVERGDKLYQSAESLAHAGQHLIETITQSQS